MKTILIIIGLFFVQNIFGQEIVLSAGENSSNDIGSLSYSIGQVISNSSNTVQIGIQQPIELFKFVDVSENKKQDININIYPNPVIDYLTVNICDDINLKQYKIRLINDEGKDIFIINNISKKIEINFSNYKQTIYLLEIFRNNEIIKTIKLIKL